MCRTSQSRCRLSKCFYLFLKSEFFLLQHGQLQGVRGRVAGDLVNLGIKTRVTCVELTDAGVDWHGVLSLTKVEQPIEACGKRLSSHETLRG